jgi:hypothetical protein
MFSTADLLTEIECGLYAAWHAAFLSNDTPYISMKPEYLTTVVLGLHLSKKLQEVFFSTRYLVRFEERTKDVATRAFPPLPLPYLEKNIHGRAKKDSGEEGSVDLVIYKQTSLFPETVAVFEIKNFDQSDGLLVKDIERNMEFIELTEPGKNNQIQYGVLTFFLHDKLSIVKEQADAFLREKTEYFSQMAAPFNRNGISSTLTLKTLANYPDLKKGEACELDDDCRLVIESEENYHIVYGIVLLERNRTPLATSRMPILRRIRT